MATVTRNSALYTRVYVNKYLSDARDRAGKIIPIPFSHTVVSGETAGASAGVQDHINLCVFPAFAMVVALFWKANAVWASAGTNGTFEIGDSGDQDRYLQATELYSAESPLPTEGTVRMGLAVAGQNYRTTAETIVFGTYKVANPVVGKIIQGCFLLVAPE
jgi:hypothetical protein